MLVELPRNNGKKVFVNPAQVTHVNPIADDKCRQRDAHVSTVGEINDAPIAR